MILIITHKQDYTVDFVVNKLNKQKINYLRLNCEDLINTDYFFDPNNNFKFTYKGVSSFKSVWFRRTKLPELDNLKKEEINHILLEFDSLLKNIFSTLNTKWLSTPKYIYEAENKVLQLKLAKEIGFSIPSTLITNQKEKIKRFYFENDKNIIIKPLAHTRVDYENDAKFIFTNLVPEKVIQSIDDFDINPCIFQENIKKDIEIRVTVVGDKLFAAAVNSQDNEETKIDWRKKKLEFKEVHIPEEIENKCRQLLKTLNINFGAIDLIKTVSGKFIFLEINPNGQWAWIEMQTGQKISDAIINFLDNVEN